MTKEKLESEIDRIVYADHSDPFSFLGMHKQLIDGTEKLTVRAFLPQARKVGVVDTETGELVADLPQVRQEGFFMGPLAGRKQAFRYRLRLLPYGSEVTYDIEDPYRFGPVLGELDIHLLVEGTHLRAFEKLGAHTTTDRKSVV